MADEHAVVLEISTGKAKSAIADIRRILSGADAAADDVEDSIDALNVTARSATKSVESLAGASKSLAGSRVSDAMRKTSRSTKEYAKAATTAMAGTRELSKQFDNASSHATKYISAVTRARKSLDGFIQKHADVDLIKREWESLASFLKKFGLLAVAQTAAGAAQFGMIETALVGVRKTTDLTTDQLEELNKTLSEASVGNLPILKTSMLEVAEAAGQVGVKGVENLEEYVKVLSELEKSSDLIGREAVERLTRILNVQGEGPGNIRQLASVLVFLGNNAAATESQIARMTNEIALSTAQFRIGSTMAAAYATAMVESGIRAELGGSVIGKVMRDIQLAMLAGGEQLNKFAAAAKMSSKDFAAAWQRGPTEALNALLKGLGQSGERMTMILEDLGLRGDEVGKVIPVLAKNFELLALRQRMAAEESERMTALSNEAARAFDTQQSDLTRLINTALQASEAFGKALSPALRETMLAMVEVGTSQEVIQFFQELGESAGTIIKILPMVAEHADLIKVAIIGVVGIKAAIWFQSTAAGAWALNAAMLPLNKATLAFVAIDIKAALASMTAGFSTASFAASGLVTSVGLAGLAGALLILNEHIKNTAEAIASSTREIVDSANSTREAWERTSEAIERGSLAILTEELSATSVELINAEVKQAKLNARLEKASVELTEYSKSSRASIEGITRLTNVVERLSDQIENQEGIVESYRAQQARLAARVRESEEEFQGLLDTVKAPGFEGWDDAEKTISEMSGAAKSAKEELEKSIKSLLKTSEAAAKAGTSVETLASHFDQLQKIGPIDEEHAEELLRLRKRLGDIKDKLEEIDRVRSLKESLAEDVDVLMKASAAADKYGVELDLMIEHYKQIEQFKYLSTEDEEDLLNLRIQLEEINNRLRENIELRSVLAQARIDVSAAEIERRMPPAAAAASAIDTETFQSSMQDAFDDVGQDWLVTAGEIEQIWEETADGLVSTYRLVEDAISGTAEKLKGALSEVANIISQMGGEIGQMAGSIADIGSAAIDYYSARRAGDSRAMTESRQALSSSIGSAVGQALGRYLSFGGVSKYGGRKAGTYASEGAQVGAMFGGWGAVVGAVFGAFVKKGADDLEIALTDAGAQIIKAEGGLADLAVQMADVLNSFVADFSQSIGQDISVAGAELSFKIRGEMLSVMVNGVSQAFDSVDQAIAWGLEQVLATIDKSNLGENLGALIGGFQPGGGTPTGDIDELRQAIGLALDLDKYIAGTGEFADELAAMFRQMDKNTNIAIRYHLSLEDLREMHESMIDAVMDRLEAESWAMFGVSSGIDRVKELAQAMEDFNRSVEGRQESELARIDELQKKIAELQQAIASAAESTGQASGEISSAGNQIEQDLRDVIDGVMQIPEATDEATRALVDNENELRSLQAELDSLLDSLGEIPEVFADQDIADLFENEVASVVKGFISLIRVWRDEEFGAQELRIAETKQYGFTLAAQVAMAQTILETVSVLSEATRSMLQGMIDEALLILDEIAGGALLPPAARPGRGRREERRETRREFEAEMMRLRLSYGGLTDAAIAIRDSVDGIREFAQEAIDAGISAERAARFISMSIEMMEETFREPFRERVLAERESPLETELRHAITQYEEFLLEAVEIATVRSEELGTSFEEALADITEELGPAFGLDVRDSILMALEGAVTEDDLAQIMEIWRTLFESQMPTAMDDGLRIVMEEIENAFSEARDEIARIEEEETAKRREELDKRLEQYKRDSSGLSEFELRLGDLNDVFQELRAETEAIGFSSEEYARRIEELSRLYSDAARRLAETTLSGFISELSQYGALTPELERIQRQLTIATLERSKADALAAISAAWAAGELQNLGMSLGELIDEITEGYNNAIQNIGSLPGIAQATGPQIPGRSRIPPGQRPGVPQAPPVTGGPETAAERDFAEELNRLLSPFEDLALGPIRREYMRLTDQFEQINSLLDEMLASEQDRLRAAQLMNLAIENFWNKVENRIDSFLDKMKQEDARISARERESMAQVEFEDLLKQVMEGDIDALDELTAAADEWSKSALEYLGTGGRYYEIFDQITAALEGVKDSLGEVPLLQAGGFTTGEGMARLHPNELILSATQTKRLIDFMNDIGPSIGTDKYGPVTTMTNEGQIVQLPGTGSTQATGQSDMQTAIVLLKEVVRLLTKGVQSDTMYYSEQADHDSAKLDGLDRIANEISGLTETTQIFSNAVNQQRALSGGLARGR